MLRPLVGGITGGRRKHLRNNFATRKSGKRKRCNELCSSACHDRLHFRAGLDEVTNEPRRLVCRDTSGNTKNDTLTLQHRVLHPAQPIRSAGEVYDMGLMELRV